MRSNIARYVPTYLATVTLWDLYGIDIESDHHVLKWIAVKGIGLDR